MGGKGITTSEYTEGQRKCWVNLQIQQLLTEKQGMLTFARYTWSQEKDLFLLSGMIINNVLKTVNKIITEAIAIIIICEMKNGYVYYYVQLWHDG